MHQLILMKDYFLIVRQKIKYQDLGSNTILGNLFVQKDIKKTL